MTASATIDPMIRNIVRQEVAKALPTALAQHADRRIVDVRGAAEYWGCSVPQIRHQEAKGVLKRVKTFDRRVRFDLRDFDAMVEKGKGI